LSMRPEKNRTKEHGPQASYVCGHTRTPRSAFSESGEKLYAHVIIAAHPQSLKTRIEDIFAMSRTVHERLMNFFRPVHPPGQVLAGGPACVAATNEIPCRVFAGCGIVVLEIALDDELFCTDKGFVSEALVPSKATVLVASEQVEFGCPAQFRSIGSDGRSARRTRRHGRIRRRDRGRQGSQKN